MHTLSVAPWAHDHAFGQDVKKSGERRSVIVILITLATMGVEISAGVTFGSMALLADGLHMGSHAAALGVSAFAYYYARRHARDARFNFGTGKVNSLAAFASALILLLFALVMAWESLQRFLAPVSIGFTQAILVAFIGLIVNGVCLLILGAHDHDHDHAHEYDHDHAHAHDHEHAHERHDLKHRDHNLWSAYVHVLADALTSLLAIFALLGGKFLGLNWLDPTMGVVGAILVAHWSWGLLRASSRVLLDAQAPEELRKTIRASLENAGDHRVSDLHVWSVGTGMYAAEIAVVSAAPLDVDAYRALLPRKCGLVHVTIEPRRCPGHDHA